MAAERLHGTVHYRVAGPEKAAIGPVVFVHGFLVNGTLSMDEDRRCHAGSGRPAAAATSLLSGLSAVAIYHYRLVAMSPAGTTYGADGTFTTGGYYENAVYSGAAMPDPFVLH